MTLGTLTPHRGNILPKLRIMLQGLEARVLQDSGRLILRVPRQLPDQELIPKSGTSFVMGSLGWQVAFTRDASGRATAISVNPGSGGAIEGKRTK